MAGRLKISSSQHSTYLRCHRLWWFQYVQKLPTPPRAFYDFGTILHEVCERYLLASELGCVPSLPIWWSYAPGFCWLTGVLAGQVPFNTIDLYPDSWDETEGRKITPVEAHLIQRLVEKAISEGILERQAGRKIEHWFSYEIISGVDMVGLIDVLNPGEIQDHKSTKDMKWAESPETLAHNVQMLNYAAVLLDQQGWNGDVTLRHNVYCKNPKKLEVRKVETTVSQRAIEQNYESLVDVAEDMKELHEHGPELEKWAEVEGPNQPDACGAYGGCPMRSICGFKSTPGAYIKRVERQIKNHDPRQKPTTWADKWGRLKEPKQGNEPMTDIFANVRKAKKAVEQPRIDGSEPAPVVDPNPTQASSEPTTALPWAFEGCRACVESPVKGLNSKGGPCFICRTMNKKAGNRTDLDYVFERDIDSATLNWEAKDGSGQGEASLAQTPEPKVSKKQSLTPASTTPVEDVQEAIDEANAKAVKAEAKRAAKSANVVLPEPKDPNAEPEPESKLEPKTKDEPIAETTEEPVKKTAGRKPRGFRIYIDCMPLGVKTILVEVLFQEMAAEVAASQAVESYYDLNPFERRDQWHKMPEGFFQEKFGSVDIVTRNPGGSPDLKAFVEALMSVAKPGHVIQGMS